MSELVFVGYILLFLIKILSVRGYGFRFLSHLRLLYGNDHPDALYLVRIPHTLYFVTQTTEAMSLTIREVLFLRADISTRFLGVIAIFKFTKETTLLHREQILSFTCHTQKLTTEAEVTIFSLNRHNIFIVNVLQLHVLKSVKTSADNHIIILKKIFCPN